jgi:hypothetical protein
MSICPLLSDPQIKKEFSELENVVGESLAYYFWDVNNGHSLDKTPTGERDFFFEDLYDNTGSRAKALQLKAVALGDNYKAYSEKVFSEAKQNKLPKPSQFSVMQSFLEQNNKKTVENLLESAFKDMESLQTIKVDLNASDKRNIKEEREYRKRMKPTAAQQARGLMWFRTNELSKATPLVVATRIANNNSLAQWTANATILYNGSDYTDLYHEAWHNFTQTYLTQAQRNVIYAEVRNRVGTYSFNGVEIPYRQLTRKQAEEVLAEEFREYMLNAKDEYTPQRTFLEKLFKKIVDLFNYIFKGKTAQESKGIVEEWFSVLKTGKINAQQNFEHNEWASLNLSKSFSEEFYTDMILRLDDSINLAIKNGLREIQLDQNYKDGVYKLLDDTVVRLVNLGNNNYRVAVIDKLEFDSLEGAELVSSLNYMFYQALNDLGLKVSDLLSLNRGEYKKQVYDRMKDSLTALFEERKALYLEDPDSVGNELVNLFNVINMWNDIKSWHGKFLNKELADYENMVESAMTPEDENERGRSSKDFENKTAADINPKEVASPIIISIIKGLPKIDPDMSVDGTPALARGSEFMLPLSGEYNTNYNILLNALSGKVSYEEMIEKVKELSKEFPQFSYLLKQLPESTEKATTDQDLQLIQAFKQSMSLPRIVPWGLRVKAKTVASKGGPVTVYEMDLFELNTTGGAKVKEQLDNQFAVDANRKYRIEDPKTGEIILNTKAIVQDYTKFFDSYPDVLSVDGKTIYTFFNDVFNMDFTPYAETAKLKSRKADLSELAIQTFARIIAQETLYSANKVEGILRPLGRLTTNYSKAVLSVFQSMGINTSLVQKEDKFKIQNIKSTANNILSLYDDLKQFYGDQSYINIEGELQWGMHQWNELSYKINRINAAKTVEDLQENEQTRSMVTNGFFTSSVFMKKLFGENGKKRNRGVENEKEELSLLGWQGMSIQGNSDTTRGSKAVDLSPEDKLAYDFFSFLKIRLVENLRFGAKSSAYSIQFKGNKKNITLFPEESFTEEYAPEFMSAMIGYLRYEMDQIKNARREEDRKFVIFDGILSPELESQLKQNAIEGKGFRDYGKAVREEIADYFNNAIDKHYEALKYSLLKNFNTLSPENQDKEMVRAFAKLMPNENITNAQWIKDKLKFYLTNYFVHQTEIVHLFVGNPRNYQTKGKGYKEVFKRLGFTSSPGRQPLVSQEFFNKLQTLGITRELEQISTQAERAYNSEIKVVVAKDLGPHQNNKESVMKYFEIQILKEVEATKGIDSKEYKELSNTKSNKLKDLVKARYQDYANQKKEADAQAWGNLDFVRVYLKSIDRWSPTLEEAYKKEVEIYRLYKEIKESRGKKKASGRITSFEDLGETLEGKQARLEDLINSVGIGLIPSLKTGLYGAELNNPEDTLLGKFSLHTLLPSVVIGAGLGSTDLADVMESMFESGTDIITFGSGQKMAFPYPEYEIYDKDMKVNKISPNIVGTYSIEGLREQQYIAPKFKEEATLSTQLVKLLFGDFFENGEFSEDYPEEFAPIVEEARKAFVDSIRHTVELEQLDMAKAMGITLDKGKVVGVDKNKFYKWLQKEAEKQDIREDFFSFLQTESEKEDPLSLDSLSYRNVAERIFVSALNKKLIRPKLNGEPYIQTASTGYSQKGGRFKNPTPEQLEEFGVNNLRNYRIENGKVQPADVKIAFNPNKHAALLNLNYKGAKIADLKRLNEALMDDAWVEANKEKITIVGVRIPVQGHNSIEMFRVREFLPTSAGPVIIVNPDIVTKSGSDFDIDKLFMYEPSYNEDGQLFDIPYSVEEYNKNLKALEGYQELISVVVEQMDALEVEMRNNSYFDSYKFYNTLYAKDKAILHKLYNLKFKPTTQKGKEVKERIAIFKQDIIEAKKAAAEARKEGDLDTLFFAKFEKLQASYKELVGFIKDLKKVPEGMLATSHNNFVKAVSNMMSQPIMFKSLTAPNNNDYLHSFIVDFYNRVEEQKGSSKRYTNVEDISKKIRGAEIFMPMTSTRIQREVVGAKSPLGISAKINAMHKLFQQSGLRFVDPFYNLYFLPARRDENNFITLGNRYTVDNVLISDVGSQFINGSVDAEKEDWINRIFADKVRTALYHQMVTLNGSSMESAVVLLLQPVMNEFFRESKQGKFKQAVLGKLSSKDAMFVDFLEKTIARVDSKLKVMKKSEKGRPVFDLKATISKILTNHGPKILSDLNFETAFTRMPPSIKNVAETKFSTTLAKKDLTAEDKDFLLKQLVTLAQYYVVEKQNSAVVTLNQNLDLNTTTFQSGQAMYNQYKFIKEGTIENQPVNEIFNQKALDYIVKESVVSPFNVSNFGNTVLENVLAITGNPKYKEVVASHMEALLATKYRYLVRGKKAESYIRNFNDDFILSLFWNYGGVGDLSVEQALPISLLQKNNPNSLMDRWIKMTESKEESYTWIMENISFAKYLFFRKVDITNPKNKRVKTYYYPVLIQTGSNDAVDAFNNELTGLINNFQGDTEEITQDVRKFFFELAMGVMAHQGFKLQRNTLQSIISASISAPYFNNAIQNFLPYINAEKNTDNDKKFQEYIISFLENEYDQLERKKVSSLYIKNFGLDQVNNVLQSEVSTDEFEFFEDFGEEYDENFQGDYGQSFDDVWFIPESELGQQPSSPKQKLTLPGKEEKADQRNQPSRGKFKLSDASLGQSLNNIEDKDKISCNEGKKPS